MTDQQINQAIAEACGWTEMRDNVVGKAPGETCNRVMFLPLYCTDLNAMAEAEKTLTREQVREYQCHMYDMACEIAVTQGRWMPYSATARYRAEAFLRALGKWEEVE